MASMDGYNNSAIQDDEMDEAMSGRSSTTDGREIEDHPADYGNMENYTDSRLAGENNDAPLYSDINSSPARYDEGDVVDEVERDVEPALNQYEDERYETSHDPPDSDSIVLVQSESSQSLLRMDDGYEYDDGPFSLEATKPDEDCLETRETSNVDVEDYGMVNGRSGQIQVGSEDLLSTAEVVERTEVPVVTTNYDEPHSVVNDNASAVANGDVGLTVKVSNYVETPAKKAGPDSTAPNQKPASGPGTFVLRSYKRADPFHVLQSLMSPDKSSYGPSSNPELDDLVTYIRQHGAGSKGEKDGDSLVTQRNTYTDTTQTAANRSSITSTLVEQFNREAQSEVGRKFAPKSPFVPPANATVATQRNDVTATPGATRSTDVAPSPQPGTTINTTTSQSTSNSAITTTRSSVAMSSADVKSSNGMMSSNDVKSSNGVTASNRMLPSQSVTSSRHVDAAVPGAREEEQSADGTGSVPAWRAEVERRKQTKDYIVSQKPKQPLTLYETPAWKRELVEKNKSRKSSSGDYGAEPTSAEIKSDDKKEIYQPEWKTEMQRALKQKSVVTESTQELPEWQRLADKK